MSNAEPPRYRFVLLVEGDLDTANAALSNIGQITDVQQVPSLGDGDTVRMYVLPEGHYQWDGDGDMGVDVEGTREGKRARDLEVGDVFQEYGDGEKWMQVVGPDTSETDTTIIRVIDAPEPQEPEPCPVTQGGRTCVYREGHSAEFNHRFA